MGISTNFRISPKYCIIFLIVSIFSHGGFTTPNIVRFSGCYISLAVSTTHLCTSPSESNGGFPFCSKPPPLQWVGILHHSHRPNDPSFLIFTSSNLVYHVTCRYFYLRLFSLALLGGLDITILYTATISSPATP